MATPQSSFTRGKKTGKPTQRVAQAARKKQAKTQVVFFDYRDERKLKRFINEQGKIIPRRITGLSAKEQRLLTKSIKWARHLAIIPFVSDQIR
ncbi:MAG: 30S ribosomal protein S18 [Chlorobiales bacterium]|nr:30S ribosomal protein S18 [Chlorobiales bacterium]